MSARHYVAGAVWHPGTSMPMNVTGESPVKHRTPEAAQRAIDKLDRAIKRGHGSAAYCDRIVIEVDEDGTRRPWDSETD